MLAIIKQRSGAPSKALKTATVPVPTPESNEMLVKVRAATVTAGDNIMIKFPAFIGYMLQLFGVWKTKQIFGSEYAGDIIEIGSSVTKFKVGDRVCGTTTYLSQGGWAEYLSVSEDGIVVLMPDNMDYAEAAAMPVGTMTALDLLSKAGIEDAQGKRVLVYGASGSVGTYAVQIAKYYGADVTGVCSTGNLEMVSEIGADQVIDYTAEDFNEKGESYDIVFDAVGVLKGWQGKKSLVKGGQFTSVKSLTSETVEKLTLARDLAQEGFIKPVIDRRYALEETIEANEYVALGHKKGNVSIIIN
eukprot:TRINITY_DN2900_c0_g1_i1.p1 TRINITY_DN2900_c0_g1~~TRINITY_DN2900_c0_g1_i1.p1  ORF type:complete len:302 (-),score=57.59 TRINITY_DN2900_c0_g1_i1:44-949(-)